MFYFTLIIVFRTPQVCEMKLFILLKIIRRSPKGCKELYFICNNDLESSITKEKVFVIYHIGQSSFLYIKTLCHNSSVLI